MNRARYPSRWCSAVFMLWILTMSALAAPGATPPPRSGPGLRSSVGASGVGTPSAGLVPSGSAEATPIPEEWFATALESIQESEYSVTWQERTVLPDVPAAWQAPNRAQGFRTYFTRGGIVVVPRIEETPSWRFGLRLVGHGRGTMRQPAAAADVATDENRIDYERGPLREWYINSPQGIEQGFALDSPPEGSGAERKGLLYVDLELTGSLRAILAADGQAVDFLGAGGIAVLHYSQLKATDADGRELKAWMTTFQDGSANGIRLVVDDAEAKFPVTIDPIIADPLRSWESDVTNAQFGASVATAGDVNGDGYSDVVVGAPYYNSGANEGGRIYVYHGSASGLPSQPTYTRQINVPGAWFGLSVATAGDVNGDGYSDVIVGAPYYTNGQSAEGAAFVYHGSSTGLLSGYSWWTEGNEANARYGTSVSSAGDLYGDGYSDVTVGAPGKDYSVSVLNAGAVYIYNASSSSGLPPGVSTGQINNEADAEYGWSVAWAGDVNGDGYSDIVVGAHLADDAGKANCGKTYLYYGSATGPNFGAPWVKAGEYAGDAFGHAVATAGDVDGDGYSDIIVGAKYYSAFYSGGGAAYVFYGPDPQSRTPWKKWGWKESSFFGQSVGTAGDIDGDGYADVIVGAYGYTGDLSHEGLALVYQGTPSGPRTSAIWSQEGNNLAADYGVSVATAGDVNGDGLSDIIVGAWKYSNGQNLEGAAFVYAGSPVGGLQWPAIGSWSGSVGGDQFGASIASAGDVNCDGYADVIVGAPLVDNGQVDEGMAYVYYGQASGPSASPDWTAEGNGTGIQLGYSVASAGDVDGNGCDDVIVGAPYDDVGVFPYIRVDAGQARVYFGASTGLRTDIGWFEDGASVAHAHFGWSVAGAGDVNGDGYADVIVGAPDETGAAEVGAVYVYHGASGGISTAWSQKMDSPSTSCTDDTQFGFVVATAGDVNGDGYSDALVGDPEGTCAGRIFAYYGSPTGLPAEPNWTSLGAHGYGTYNQCYGCVLGSAGDVNGDGYSDIIAADKDYRCYGSDPGDCHDSPTGDACGQARIFSGSSGGLGQLMWEHYQRTDDCSYGSGASTVGDINNDGFADWVVYDTVWPTWEVYLGASSIGRWRHHDFLFQFDGAAKVVSAGDVNADGLSDIIASFPGGTGWARVFRAGGEGVVAWRPQQLRADDASPIAFLGMSEHRYDFRTRLIGRAPTGRGDVKLQWEVKPWSQRLNGTNLGTASTWLDSGTGSVQLNQRVSGAVQSETYHWRARALYRPATTPLLPHGPWFTLTHTGWQEASLRTLTVDADHDGWRDFEDCNDGRADIYPGAPELCDEVDNECDGSVDDAPPPSGSPSLTVTRIGAAADLGWTVLAGASGYDLVRGTLTDLRSSGGNFTISTKTCLGLNLASPGFTDLSGGPSAGEGWWYLVRGQGTTCGGPGTYDTGATSQVGSRDAEVDAAAYSCHACAHGKCGLGGPLSSSCNPCVATVCAADPFCCNTSWDGLCIEEVRTICASLVCIESKGSCAHVLCETGVKLVPGCDSPPLPSSCVTTVCNTEPYCCNGAWDDTCLQWLPAVCPNNCN